MRYRVLVSAGALAFAFALLSPVPPDAAQAPGSVTPRFSTTPRFTPPKSTYVPPKTEWGDPDISGVYDFMTFIRMQRPPEYAGKKTLTETELKEYSKRYAPNEDACGTGSRAGEICTPEQDAQVGDYNEFWDTRKWVRDNRSALIEDPEDGRIPPMTPEAQKRFDEWAAARRARTSIDSWLDFSTVTRCIAEQTPNGPQMYNSGTLIMQAPGWVMLVRERLDTRFIALDGRPHLDPAVRLWHGHSVGRWEGNTLVVDTTNFTDKQIMGGVGSTVPAGIPFGNIHLVEHFVPVSANRLHYYATIEDPTTWVRPWTFMLPWEKDPGYVIYEYACHEGDLSIENALRGERIQEAKRAELARLDPKTHTLGLVGRTEADIRALFGEPMEKVNTRWIYETVTGRPLYLYFGEGVVKIVAPNDLPIADVKKR
jgi:hypothetical protein